MNRSLTKIKYLIDTNYLLENFERLNFDYVGLSITEDIANEYLKHHSSSKLIGSNIEVVKLEDCHYSKIGDIINAHGKNLNFISLYSNKGMADVTSIAYIYEQNNNPDNLFEPNWHLVTTDNTLKDIALEYGINVVNRI